MNKDDDYKITINSLLKKYYTSRIDMKNYGKENSVEIIENSDPLSNVEYPSWFNNNTGKGMMVESTAGVIDLKIKCIKNGTLKISIKSNNTIDKNKNHFPVYINYSSVIINKKEYIKEDILVCHDEPLIITKQVKDNELISIHAEWTPFNPTTSIYKNKTLNKLEEKLEELTNKNKQQEEEIKKLKDINKRIETKLKRISNSSLKEFRKIKKEL